MREHALLLPSALCFLLALHGSEQTAVSPGAVRQAIQQQSSTITGIVRNATGDLLAYGRVRVTGAQFDTTVRTGVDGKILVNTKFGAVHVHVTLIGYVPADVDQMLDKEQVSLSVVMTATPHQLAEVSVHDNWIGVRGIVGDSATMEPIPGVTVRTIRRGKKVVTDSMGRFEISLPRSEQIMLNLQRAGFQTRPANVDVPKSGGADVVLFMTRGKDPVYLKQSLVDLDHRIAAAGVYAALIDRKRLLETKAPNLLAAIMESGELQKHGLTIYRNLCLFIDGIPIRDGRVQNIRTESVDFVELYAGAADQTKSLASRWPHGVECAFNDVPFITAPRQTYLMYVAAWLRK